MDCGQCHTRVEGVFRPSAFDRLSPESLAFIELFVRLKGNVKGMERELSVAYSTVRHRLDDVVRELGPANGGPLDTISGRPPTPPAVAAAEQLSDDPAVAAKKHDILNRLDLGEITPAEAVQLLGGESP